MFPVWVVAHVFVYLTAALDLFPTSTKFGMNIIPLKYIPPVVNNNNAADAQNCEAGEVEAAVTLGYSE
jgi:hypothetical protein